MRGIGGDALREARLEHEGERAFELVRLQLGVARVLEGFDVGAMRQHGVVQRHAARHEALRLGVVLAIDQPHELAHDVHVVPGRPERILRHQPAIREDHEVDIGGARRLGGRGQHGEDRGVGMVEQDRPDRGEAAQIVFVGRVVAVPGDDIERRVIDLASPRAAAPFHEHPGGRVAVLVGGDRRQEIARVGEAVRADGAALGQRERAAIILAEIAARRAVLAARRGASRRAG